MPISPEGCGFDWWRPIVCLPKWCGVGFSKLLSMLNKRSMGHLLSIWWHNPPGSWPELDSCSHRAPWHQVVTLSSICDFTRHYYIRSKYFFSCEKMMTIWHTSDWYSTFYTISVVLWFPCIKSEGILVFWHMILAKGLLLQPFLLFLDPVLSKKSIFSSTESTVIFISTSCLCPLCLSTTAILSTCSEQTFSIPYSLFYGMQGTQGHSNDDGVSFLSSPVELPFLVDVL